MEISVFADSVLRSSELESKLFSPDSFSDDHPHIQLSSIPREPGRPAELKWSDQKAKVQFPSASQLIQATGRGQILHFFSNHELLALELMALALLRFPEAPKSFRLGIAHTMLEEQQHLRLYLDRMETLGVGFGDLPVNRFFWDCLNHMESPLDYLVGMSLTFEQANLDFSAYYIEQMKRVGDIETTSVLEKVLADEIGHVKFGLKYFDRFRDQNIDRFDDYCSRLTVPLSPSRAKAKPFNIQARREAGFTDNEIQRLSLYGGSKGRPPIVFDYNSDCELEMALGGRAYTTPPKIKSFIKDLSLLPVFLASTSDVILTPTMPSHDFLTYLKNEVNFDLPEIICTKTGWHKTLEKLSKRPTISHFQPWGWSPRAYKKAKDLSLGAKYKPDLSFLEPNFEKCDLVKFYRKDYLPAYREAYRAQAPSVANVFGSSKFDGRRCECLEDVLDDCRSIWTQYERPALVKSPFGAAAWGNRKFRDERDFSANMLNWITTQIRLHGAVLVEPWLDKQIELSYSWFNSKDKGRLTHFYCDAKGRYLGHHMGRRWWQTLGGDLQRFLFEVGAAGQSVVDYIEDLAVWVKKRLETISYRGPAAIDLFIYRDPLTRSLKLRLLSEINPRYTMAHVARQLYEKILLQQHDSALFTIFRESELRTCSAPCESLKDLAPYLMKNSEQLSKDQKGKIIILNDWKAEPKSLVLLAVGKDAEDLLKSLRKPI